tara:strand:- start:1158 stop:5477 length:4320 start_codon:yes stop_codon:yes gene_type:complete
MRPGFLILGELPSGLDLRVQRLASICNFPLRRIKSGDSSLGDLQDLEILVSWGLDVGALLDNSSSLKAQIGEIPLLWLNESSLDERIQEKVSASHCDGFMEISELEAIVTDIYKLEKLTDLTQISGLRINHRRKPGIIKVPRSSARRNVHEVFGMLDPNQKVDFQGYYPMIFDLGSTLRCSHSAILSTEGFRRGVSLQQRLILLQELCQTHRIRKFHFHDQEMNADLNQLREFCELVAENDLKFSFKTGFEFKPMRENLFNLLVDAGLEQVTLTLYSGSDRLLYHNNIEMRLSQMRRNLRQFHAVGIDVHLKVYVGMPGEQYVDYFRTLDFLKQNSRYIKSVESVQSLVIEPNSPIYRASDKSSIKLNPGELNSWVKQEKDHLNDFAAREQKRLFMLRHVHMLGLYAQAVDTKTDLNEIQNFKTEYEESKVDVTLVNCPPWGYLNPPVGVAKVSSYVRNHGRKTRILDYNVQFYLEYEEMQRLWHVENKSYWSSDRTFDVIRYIYDEDIERAVEEILDRDSKVIGFSCVDPKERMTVEFIRRLRARCADLVIILGGPVCGTSEYRNIFFDKLGEKGVDIYVVGEGEDTMLEILERVDKGESLSGTPGTVEADEDGNWHFAPARTNVDIWNAPITTYEEFDLSNYSCQELIVEWSRGCIGTCAFCKAKVLDGKFRSYNPDAVVAGLKHYVEEYGITKFTVSDLAVNGNWKLLEKVCDKIIESGLKVEIRAQGIPRRQMKLPILKKMKQAGFVEVQWGVESGSDKVLKAMDKEWMFTIDEAQQVIRDSYASGIKTCMFCMVGYPTEEDEDFQKTYEFIDRNAEYLDMVKSVNSLHIITDTPVHHKAVDFGVSLPDENYHFLWEMPGNTHEIRQERVKTLLELVKVKGLECLETNYLEGRQFVLLEDYKTRYIPMDERVDLLRRDINTLIDYRMNEQEEWENIDNPRDKFIENNRDLVGVQHGQTALVAPNTVEIDLSNNCNFNCVGCWCHCDSLQELKTPAQRKKNHLDFESIKGLVKDLAENGTQTIQLAGPGEPFTHPQIMDVIRYIKGNGLELHIITNFSFITHAIAQELMDLKVDQLTCSLWAGSPEAFVKTHPNQTAKTFARIKEVLTFVGMHKKYNSYPRIKIYNVINKLNSDDLENMVNYGLEVRADTMEFTVVDTVPGKTDFLALSEEDLRKIEEAFEKITGKATYPDPPGRKHLKGLTKDQLDEHHEVNAKYFTDMGDYKSFDYEPLNKVMTCRAGLSNERMEHDPFERCANVFYFSQDTCKSCKYIEECEVDKKDFSIKTRFFAVLGFGSFIRRARLSVEERAKHESEKEYAAAANQVPSTPLVDTMPCTIGWTYSRVTTDGNVIPCCKGYEKPLGNLYQNHFKHIWNDHPYREFRDKAKNLKKSDLYFQEIGCHKACDNIGHNLEILKRLNNLKPREKQWLEGAAKQIRP